MADVSICGVNADSESMFKWTELLDNHLVGNNLFLALLRMSRDICNIDKHYDLID